jgi:hypothetical protein
MNSGQILSKLEHFLLSTQCNDSEPLFILYSDAVRNMPNATLEMVLKGLLRLFILGYSRVMIVGDGKTRYLSNLSLDELTKRFLGQSEKEKREYPTHVDEYYFEITEKGRQEESKEVYSSYYPQDSQT